MWKRIEETVTSFRFVVILILALVLATIAGAVFPQRLSPDEYRGILGDTGYSVVRFVGLTNVYHAAWFSLGIILLALSTFLCTVRRFSIRPRRLGFTITHISLVVLAVSYGASQVWGIRGQMRIYRGESTSLYYAEDSQDDTGYRGEKLPFDVRLNDFRVEYYPPDPGYLIVFQGDNEAYEAVPVRLGASLRSSDGDYQATVKEVIPDYTYDEAKGTLRAASSEFNDPAIRVELTGPAGYREETWLFQNDPSVSRDLSFSDEEPGAILVSSPEGEILGGLPAREGEETQVKGTTETVRILQVVPNFVIDGETGETESRSEEWKNPAARILVTGGGSEPVTFWVFALYPKFTMGRKDLPFEVKYHPKKVASLSVKIRELQKNRLPVRMAYIPGNPSIKAFISDVSILDGDSLRLRGKIMVNRPMKYGGYKFYQESWDPERLEYTVLGVKKDPAVPGILFGSVLLCIGVTAIYTIRPILEHRERGRSSATEA